MSSGDIPVLARTQVVFRPKPKCDKVRSKMSSGDISVQVIYCYFESGSIWVNSNMLDMISSMAHMQFFIKGPKPNKERRKLFLEYRLRLVMLAKANWNSKKDAQGKYNPWTPIDMNVCLESDKSEWLQTAAITDESLSDDIDDYLYDEKIENLCNGKPAGGRFPKTIEEEEDYCSRLRKTLLLLEEQGKALKLEMEETVRILEQSAVDKESELED